MDRCLSRGYLICFLPIVLIHVCGLKKEGKPMKLIVGLGNPGEKYEGTRHNVGFMVLDKLAHEIGKENLLWKSDTKHHALIATTGDLMLVKPTTFMNDSGNAVASLLSYYKALPEDVILIHDDMDLPLGKIRIRSAGGTAGHHGVESVLEAIKTVKVVRVRLGIGKEGESETKKGSKAAKHHAVIAFVLSRFTKSEAGPLRHLVDKGANAVRMILTEGIDVAMNRIH